MRLDPWTERHDRGPRLDRAAIGGDPNTGRVRLDLRNGLAQTNLGAAHLRKADHCFDRRLGLQEAAVRLHHADVFRRHPKGWKPAHHFRRGQELVR